jgi:fructose-bisphosphate aldolase class 1
MNRYAVALLAVSAAAFGGQALAESPNAVAEQQFQGGKSRAEVQAELAQYKQAGVNPWSISHNPLRAFKSTAARADVTAQYIAARDEVAAFGREDSGAAFLARNGQSVPAETTLAGQPAANVR